MITLRPYQDQGVNDIRAAMAISRRVLFVLPTGGGKCLAKDTPVMMYDGRVKPVQSVIVGDFLMGPDSLPREVVSLARGREEMFSISPKIGEPFVVNKSHILSVKMTNGSMRSCGTPNGSIINLTVEQYLAKNKTFKHCAKAWRAAVDFQGDGAPLKLDPYFLGVWLGDGSSRHASITTGDDEIKGFVQRYAASLGMFVREEYNSQNSVNLHLTSRQGKTGGKGRGYMDNPIKLALSQYGLLGNKHIPLAYKTASREVRLKVLAGIMDTDGYWGGKGFDLTLKDERLMRDVAFVARSLGFSCNIRRTTKKCGNNGVVGAYWRATFNGPVETIPTALPRKKAPPRKQKKDVLLSGFSVDSIGYGDYYGFEIAGPDRLFLLGDFTVTHNTVTFSYITYCAQAKGKRIYILAHRSEIIDQISAALSQFGIRHGRIQPGWTPTNDPVQCGMIQTASRRLTRLLPPDMVIFDEAHHAIQGQYKEVMDCWPNAKILGVTATPERLDGRGLGEQFEIMVQGPTTRWLIENGFLADFEYYAPKIDIDLSNVKVRMGDYETGALAEALDKPKITGDAVKHYKTFLSNRKAIGFCVSVAHAEHVADTFRASGVPALSIDGSMARAERAHRVTALKTGQIMVLTSCDLISEGFDVPSVSGAIMLRPSKSMAMVMQQWGRCIRLKEDGSKAIILDHVGHVNQFGTPKTVREWSLDSKKRKSEDLGVRQCGLCFKAFLPEDERLCDERANPDCLFFVKSKDIMEAGEKREIEYAEGDLVAYTDSPVWAGGIDIIRASGPEWRALLAKADSYDRLRDIGRARGYKPAWAHFQWKSRNERRSAGE